MNFVAPGVYSRYSREELKNIFRELDMVIADLDECIFPGITEVSMYRNICLNLISSRKIKNCLLLGRLLVHAVAMYLMKFGQVLYFGITNRQLIFYFTKSVRSVPRAYLEKATVSIPGGSYAGARETLEILSEKAKVGIISQGLDIVLNEYVKQFKSTKSSIIDFWDGNILAELVDYRNKVRSDFIFDRHDKETRTRRRIAQFGSHKTMVIGHNRDDLGMMKVVKEHGGIVVGFNPTSEVKKWCDIVVTGKNWLGLKQIFTFAECHSEQSEESTGTIFS